MKQLFSIIAKVGIALAIFGFFQPVACDQNAFKLAETAQDFGKGLGGFGSGNTQLSIALYLGIGAVFIAALLGLAALANSFARGFELAQTLMVFIAIGSFTFAFVTLNKDLELQRGAWLIGGGLLDALLFGIASLPRKKR